MQSIDKQKMEKKKKMQKDVEHAMVSGGAESHFDSSKGIAPGSPYFLHHVG